jgi:hypothetical protein
VDNEHRISRHIRRLGYDLILILFGVVMGQLRFSEALKIIQHIFEERAPVNEPWTMISGLRVIALLLLVGFFLWFAYVGF